MIAQSRAACLFTATAARRAGCGRRRFWREVHFRAASVQEPRECQLKRGYPSHGCDRSALPARWQVREAPWAPDTCRPRSGPESRLPPPPAESIEQPERRSKIVSIGKISSACTSIKRSPAWRNVAGSWRFLLQALASSLLRRLGPFCWGSLVVPKQKSPSGEPFVHAMILSRLRRSIVSR